MRAESLDLRAGCPGGQRLETAVFFFFFWMNKIDQGKAKKIPSNILIKFGLDRLRQAPGSNFIIYIFFEWGSEEKMAQ